jgi:hypothetical protein
VWFRTLVGGEGGEHWRFLEEDLQPLGFNNEMGSSPFITGPFSAKHQGFYVDLRIGQKAGKARVPRAVQLDKETIEQLRSLGYTQ